MAETPDRSGARLWALFLMVLSARIGWPALHEGLELEPEARLLIRLVTTEEAYNQGLGAVCVVVFVASSTFFFAETIRVWWMLRKLRQQHERERRQWDAYFQSGGPAPGAHGGQLFGEGIDGADEPRQSR